MKNILLSILLVSLYFSWVDSQCMNVVKQYLRCRDSLHGEPKDELYQQELAGVDTFEKAMDYFKKLYALSDVPDCQQNHLCKCLNTYGELDKDLKVFFRKNNIYNGFKRLLREARQLTLRDMEAINEQSRVGTQKKLFIFNPKTPTLNEFCHKYEYGQNLMYFFQETLSCMQNITPEKHESCANKLELDYMNPANVEKLEASIQCLLDSLEQTCPKNAKNLIKLVYLINYPYVVRGDFYNFINIYPSSSAIRLNNGALVVLLNLALYLFAFLKFF